MYIYDCFRNLFRIWCMKPENGMRQGTRSFSWGGNGCCVGIWFAVGTGNALFREKIDKAQMPMPGHPQSVTKREVGQSSLKTPIAGDGAAFECCTCKLVEFKSVSEKL